MIRKRAKEGVALILTISVLSALSILGITFMMLLTRDQALMQKQVATWNSDAAVDSAIRAGIQEIEKQLSVYSPNYFGSTIQTAYEAKRDSEVWNTITSAKEEKRIVKSSFLGRIWDFDNQGADITDVAKANPGYIYFKNIIRASNAKLSLYQSGPEFRNLLISLGTVLKADNTSTKIDEQARRIADTLLIYHTNWVPKDVDEILKMPICVDGAKADAKEKAEAADLLKPYLTTTPVHKLRIIDEGYATSSSTSTKLATDGRDFLPIDNNQNAMKGLQVKIVKGTGEGQINIVDTIDTSDTNRLNLENTWGTTPDATSYYQITNQGPPTPQELAVNIIDYGQCLNNSTDYKLLIADKRDFLPPSSSDDIYALKGAIVTIIAGEGEGQYNYIDTIDSSNTNRLNLLLDWRDTKKDSSGTSIGDVPDNTSYYRIHSLVSPINFNAADRELIEANLSIPLDSFTSLGKGIWIDQIDPTTNVGEIRGNIQGVRKPSLNRLYKDYIEWRTNDTTKVPSLEQGIIPKSPLNQNNLEKDYFGRLFMLSYPKAIDIDQDGVYEVPLLPVPFTFAHNGYFDMEITSAMKKYAKAKNPLKDFKKYVTVRIEGRTELSLREEFEEERSKVNWMTTNDFTPFQSLIDFSDWYMKNPNPTGSAKTNLDNTDAYDSKGFHPYNWVDPNPTKYWDSAAHTTSEWESEKFPNMVPDSIKTGLWLDFGGEGKFYDQESSEWKELSDLPDIFQTDRGEDITLDASEDNNGLCKGNATLSNLPESAYQLGTDSSNEYYFADVCTVIKLIDTAKNVYIAHPPNNSTYYDYTASGNTFDNHNYNDHKQTEAPGIKYPPEKYFTPTLELWHDDTGTHSNLSVTFREEKGYDADLYNKDNDFSASCFTTSTPITKVLGKQTHTFAVSAENPGTSPTDVNTPNVEAYRAITNTYAGANDWWNEVTICALIAKNPESASDYFVNVLVSDEENVDDENQVLMPYVDSVMFYKDLATNGGNTSTLGKTPTHNSPFGTIPATDMNGYIRIKRDWGVNYYSETNSKTPFTGDFHIDYLRVLPGPKTIGSTTTYPYFQSAPLILKNAKYLKKVRVWYQTSQHSSFSSHFNPNSTFSFKFNLLVRRLSNLAGNHDWDQNPDITYDDEYIEIATSNAYDYSRNDPEGYQDIYIAENTTNQDILDNSDQNIEFRIETCYENRNEDKELISYLKTTIAITRIEVFYSVEPTVIQSSDTP